MLLGVSAGGAVGAVLRWEVGTRFGAATGFGWSTFAINVAGSALLAALGWLSAVRRSPVLAATLGAGVLGGFTTLSTMSEETRALAAEGQLGTAAAYAGATLVTCLVAVAAVNRLAVSGAAATDQDAGQPR